MLLFCRSCGKIGGGITAQVTVAFQIPITMNGEGKTTKCDAEAFIKERFPLNKVAARNAERRLVETMKYTFDNGLLDRAVCACCGAPMNDIFDLDESQNKPNFTGTINDLPRLWDALLKADDSDKKRILLRPSVYEMIKDMARAQLEGVSDYLTYCDPGCNMVKNRESD